MNPNNPNGMRPMDPPNGGNGGGSGMHIPNVNSENPFASIANGAAYIYNNLPGFPGPGALLPHF